MGSPTSKKNPPIEEGRFERVVSAVAATMGEVKCSCYAKFFGGGDLVLFDLVSAFVPALSSWKKRVLNFQFPAASESHSSRFRCYTYCQE